MDSAFERSGADQPGDVHRYGMPRSDLRVTARGVTVRPAFALGSWLAMKPHGDGVVAAGEVVLAEVNPVIRSLTSSGIDFTSLPSLMLDEEPGLFFMHFRAEGDAAMNVRRPRQSRRACTV